MPDSLTFTIQPDGESASVRLFLRALESIERLIRDVDYAITRERSTQRWVIGALHASAPTVTVRPVGGGLEAVDAIANGIRLVTIGTDEPPTYFTEDALDDLRKMKSLFSGKNRARSIVVSADGVEAATISDDISDKVERILSAGFHNLGSLVGTLEAINLHGAPTFTIWDRVSGSPVRCYFPRSPEWVERVKYSLERQVLVQGHVRYFTNGVPRSITDLQALDASDWDADAPRGDFGSIPDAEAAQDPAEFLRIRRGG